MNSNKKAPFLDDKPSPSWWEKIIHSSWSIKIYEHKRYVAITAAALLVLMFLTVLIVQKRAQKQVVNYETALAYAAQLQMGPRLFKSPQGTQSNMSNPKERAEVLGKLIALADETPMILDHFHGLIADELMLTGKIEEAKPYIKAAIEEAEHFGLSLYAQFSQSSVLLEESQFQQAEDLVLQMLNTSDIERQPILYAFTLLQKAIIEQKLGKYNDSLQTIDKLRVVIKYGENPALSRFIAPEHDLTLFESHLQDQQISLLDFLTLSNNK